MKIRIFKYNNHHPIAMAKLVSEKDIEKIVVPALRDWVKASGIQRFLGQSGVKDCVFLIVGGAGCDYAKGGKSDVDLMLIFDPCEKRGSIDDFKRLHARMQGYVKEKAKNLDSELEIARRARIDAKGEKAVLEEEKRSARLDEGLESERARLASSRRRAR